MNTTALGTGLSIGDFPTNCGCGNTTCGKNGTICCACAAGNHTDYDFNVFDPNDQYADELWSGLAMHIIVFLLTHDAQWFKVVGYAPKSGSDNSNCYGCYREFSMADLKKIAVKELAAL